MNFINIKKGTLIVSLMLAFTLVITACSGGSSKSDKIVVGGKDYTEQDILVHLVSEFIEGNTDLEIDRKPFLGGSNVVTTAQFSGDVDIMVDYTGTGLVSVLKQEVEGDSDQVYRTVKEEYDEKYDIKWLEPLGFNNTYALTMREDMAEELGIETTSDLKDHAGDFSFASNQEFSEREDGLDAMSKEYGIEFKDIKDMDQGLTYTSLDEGLVDVSVSYTTDGRIPAFNLRLLEDDKSFFPPYDSAILVRNETLAKYEGLEEVLSKLGGQISQEEMAKMNSLVDLEKQDPKKVAKDWLTEKGLI